MPDIEFVGQSSRDPDNSAANSSRLVNLYRERINGRSEFVLKSVLGTARFANLEGVFMRAMAQVRGVLFVVIGGSFYRVNRDGVQTFLGAVEDSPETTISSNNGVVTIAAGGKLYTWNGTTLAQPETGAFDAVGSVEFLGQRTILTERGGRRVQWSDVADPDTFDGLDFATTESTDDNNVRAVSIGAEFWVFKEQSIERWLQSGAGFSPLAGATLQVGLKAFGLVTKTPLGAFFVGSDNRAYVAGGGAIQPISTLSVETSIEQQTATHAFHYSDEGHEFYVIRFSDRPAWCFDVATGEWHERAEGAGFAPWGAVACVKAFGGFLVGDDLGKIHKLERINQDESGPLIRRAVSRSLRMEGRRFRVPMLEFLGRVGWSRLGEIRSIVLDVGTGFGLSDGDNGALVTGDLEGGDVPSQMMLRLSRDYGHTWTDPKAKSLGNLGEYDQRMCFRALGQFRSLTAEITLSDPVEIPIDATATVQVR